MKVLMLTYSGADPDRVSALLDEAGVPVDSFFYHWRFYDV